ncbi:MAG: hypothetical protein AB1626_03235 [Candidatus Micrarchaeota archaeon]
MAVEPVEFKPPAKWSKPVLHQARWLNVPVPAFDKPVPKNIRWAWVKQEIRHPSGRVRVQLQWEGHGGKKLELTAFGVTDLRDGLHFHLGSDSGTLGVTRLSKRLAHLYDSDEFIKQYFNTLPAPTKPSAHPSSPKLGENDVKRFTAQVKSALALHPQRKRLEAKLKELIRHHHAYQRELTERLKR